MNTQMLFSHAGLPTFETLNLNPNTLFVTRFISPVNIFNDNGIHKSNVSEKKTGFLTTCNDESLSLNLKFFKKPSFMTFVISTMNTFSDSNIRKTWMCSKTHFCNFVSFHCESHSTVKLSGVPKFVRYYKI